MRLNLSHLSAASMFRLSLGFFVLAGLLGALLRMFFFWNPLELAYKYVLHTHSHVVLLGWVFNAIYAGIVYMFFRKNEALFSKYKNLFVYLQITVLGMLFTFPFQGYGKYSITFSTAHIILTYVFIWHVLKNLKGNVSIAAKWIKVSLVFLLASTIGPFILGAIMALDLFQSQWYHLAVYYYLHFLYNGAFTFAIFAMFFYLLEKYTIQFSLRNENRFYWLMAVSCVPAYALSALWTHPPAWIYGVATFAALCQLVALGYFIGIAKSIWPALKESMISEVRVLLKLSLVAFCLKTTLQAVSAIPYFATLAYEIRNFTIGYLHLVFIGFISLFLIAWFGQVELVRLRKRFVSYGLMLFIASFVLSEALIVTQPIASRLTYYYIWLFVFSAMMAAGLLFMFLYDKGIPDSVADPVDAND